MGKFVDLTNNKYGHLTVIERVDPIIRSNGRKVQQWLCKCDCGNECIVRHGNLTSGTTTSCGCFKSKVCSDRKLEDIVGKKYGELTVLCRYGDIGGKKVRWVCKCSCGRTTIADGHNLKTGNTTSCGCMKNSLGESIIVHLLNKYCIDFEKEKKFSDLISTKNYPLRFDFAIYNKEKQFFLLEYQGIQHFKEQADGFGYDERVITDPIKKEYCNKNNIELVEIRYDENIEIRMTEILLSHDLLHDNFVPSSIGEGVTTIS